MQIAADAFALGERGEPADLVVTELELGLAQALFAMRGVRGAHGDRDDQRHADDDRDRVADTPSSASSPV